MTWQPNRRQFIALGSAAASAGLMSTAARSQSTQSIRVGAVFPSRSGLTRTLTSLNDFIGQGARQGSLLAESRLGTLDPGIDLVALQASAPTPESAIRATERLVELEDIDALLGGVGEGQLEAMTPIAEAAGIPLFNIGTQDDSFRHASCSRNVFHIEASDAMYLDAMIAWSASMGHRRWFIFHEDNERGFDLQARVLRSISKFGQSGEAVGAAATPISQPVYLGEIDQARRAEADAVLVLLNVVDQIAFFGQMQTAEVDLPVIPLADSVGQTRDFILALRQITEGFTPETRFQLWEPTLQDFGAGAFNEAYLGRFSAPADPTAWAAYAATKILYETVRTVGTTDADAIIDHLETGAEYDVFKGPGTSFRAWDHQLRQPLYRLHINTEFEVEQAMVGANIPSQLGVASLEAIMPEGEPTGDAVTWLDQFGDGPEDSACQR